MNFLKLPVDSVKEAAKCRDDGLIPVSPLSRPTLKSTCCPWIRHEIKLPDEAFQIIVYKYKMKKKNIP